MSAVDQLLRRMERYMAARKPGLIRTPAAPRKPAKPRKGEGRGKARNRKHQTAVSLGRRASKPVHDDQNAKITKSAYRPKELAYTPPRTEPDVTELVETFAPGPISAALFVPPAITTQPSPAYDPFREPDWVDGRATERPARPSVEVAPPAPLVVANSATPRTARGSCKAIDAATGRQCRLLAHPEAPDWHRSERGPFNRLALPGQTRFLRQELLDAAATARPEAGNDLSQASLGSGDSRATKSKGAGNGELGATIAKYKRAHAGDVTTEANKPERSKYFTPEVAGGGQ